MPRQEETRKLAGNSGEVAESQKALVSVVLPCRNDAQTIEAAVESVCCQEWGSIEILLCDDGSTDNTVTIARRTALAAGLPISVIETGGRGAAAARNAGIRAAKGQVIAFLDSDDLWFEKKISTCMYEIHGGADVVMHAEEWRDEQGGVQTVRYANLVDSTVPFPLSVYRTNPFSTSAMVIRRDILDQTGLFDEQIESAEDYDLWLRVSLVPDISVRFIDDVLGVYSVRSGSESSRIAARHQAMLEIGRRYRHIVASLDSASILEGLRYNSRVRLATGIRFLRAGKYARGAMLAAIGLMQWPIRPEITRWVRARRPRAGETRQRVNA